MKCSNCNKEIIRDLESEEIKEFLKDEDFIRRMSGKEFCSKECIKEYL
jgi:hypothetical protein